MEGQEVFDSVVDPLPNMALRFAVGLVVFTLLVLASPMLMDNLKRTVESTFRSMLRPPRRPRF